MPQKKKKESGEQSPASVDLTSFLERPPPDEERRQQPYLSEDIENAILSLVRSRGPLTRSELYEWSKKRGIKPAELYRCLSSLLSRGALNRKFDAEREEYVFYVPQR